MAEHILLVEDEPELTRALSIRLSSSGFTCDIAGNGREALAKFDSRKPNLVIMDLLMPEMDGYELCRWMKNREDTRKIPVLVLTAVPEQTLKSRLNELKDVRIMRKPFQSEALIAAIRELLSSKPEGG